MAAAEAAISGQCVADTAAEWHGLIVYQYHLVRTILFKLVEEVAGVVLKEETVVGQA